MSAFSLLKRVVPRSVKTSMKRLLGMESAGRPQSGTLDHCFRDLARIPPTTEEEVVVDVGAHDGFFAHSWLNWRPRSTVYCFEPQAEPFDKLTQRFAGDTRVRCWPLALGSAASQRELILHGYTATTSFLRMTPLLAAAAPSLAIVEVARQPATIVTLDGFAPLQEAAIRLLKIDVQGYELEVLRGAVSTLDRVDYVFVEVQFVPLYEGAPLFTEVFDWLNGHGFKLIAFTPHNLACEELVEGDMLFRNRGARPAGSTGG